MDSRKKIAEAWRTRTEAINEFKTKGAEREQQQLEARKRADHQEQQKAIQRAEKFHQLAEAARNQESLKPYLSAPDDDPKAKELLTKGMKDAERAFGIGEDEPMSEDDQLALHASVLNKAGSWAMNRYLSQKKSERISELEKKLAEYEKSEPTTGGGAPAGGAAADDDDIDARMMKFANA
jgi:hypothetical protein